MVVRSLADVAPLADEGRLTSHVWPYTASLRPAGVVGICTRSWPPSPPFPARRATEAQSEAERRLCRPLCPS
jgi:hypothetical protein